MGRIFAIGDIHGMAGQLEKLMAGINWDPSDDTLVFIGDYVDRGPASSRVISHILKLHEYSENIICLKGNHEDMLLEFLDNKNIPNFLYNGGQTTIESYGGPEGGIPEEHFDFLHNLKLYWETEEYIFVHAGLRDGIPLAEQDPHDCMWIRDEFISSSYDHGKRVIYGHTPTRKPYVRKNKIGIDTGAVYGGHLTCLEIPRLVFHSV